MSGSTLRLFLFGNIGVGRTTISKYLKRISIGPICPVYDPSPDIFAIPDNWLDTSTQVIVWDPRGDLSMQLHDVEMARPHVVIIVTDSSTEDCILLSEYLHQIRELDSDIKFLGIANKQDRLTARSAEDIKQIIGMSCIEFCALDFFVSHKHLFCAINDVIRNIE